MVDQQAMKKLKKQEGVLKKYCRALKVSHDKAKTQSKQEEKDEEKEKEDNEDNDNKNEEKKMMIKKTRRKK